MSQRNIGAKEMSALLRSIHSRQTRLSGGSLSSQRWLFEDHLKCRYQDEIVLHGRLREGPVPSFACKFTRDGLHGHLLAVSDEDGSVRFFDTRKLLSESLISEVVCHDNAIFDISWLPGGNRLLTASGDQTVRLWDVVTGARLDNFQFHTGSVKSVDSSKDEPSMFASGCRNGSICIWDIRCSARSKGHKPVNTIAMGHRPPNKEVVKKRRRVLTDVNMGVASVVFHGSYKLASAGSGDGTVKLWDLRRTYSIRSKLIPPVWLSSVRSSSGKTCGFTSLLSDSYQSFLFATCTDGNIYRYNSGGLITRPVNIYSGSRISSFYVKSCISPDDKFLLSGSSDGNGFIWEIDRPESPPLLLPSTRGCDEVSAVDWCPSLDKVVICSDENDARLWRVRRGGIEHTMEWEVTGSCFEDPTEEHLKAKDILQRYSKTEKKKEESLPRNPLHPLNTIPQTNTTPRNGIQTTPRNGTQTINTTTTPQREESSLMQGMWMSVGKRSRTIKEDERIRKKVRTPLRTKLSRHTARRKTFTDDGQSLIKTYFKPKSQTP